MSERDKRKIGRKTALYYVDDLCYNTAMDGSLETSLFNQGYDTIGAIDEAGRGPLAGPVVAACVMINPNIDLTKAQALGIKDSKLLTTAKRERIYGEIRALVNETAIGIASVEEIDRINILEASLLAMHRAVNALRSTPKVLLIDGIFRLKGLPEPQITLKGGDRKVLSVAAASIIAKVERDRIMMQLNTAYPQYGFNRHKGYGTREHLERLRILGVCPEHRRSFRPISKLLS